MHWPSCSGEKESRGIIGRLASPGEIVLVLAGIAVLLVVGLVGLVLVAAPWNPMLLVFLQSFEMYNGSGAEVWATPIGMWEGSGRYGPLPRYKSKNAPAFRSREMHDIRLRSGESVTIVYDCDDINFRHILVRTPSGRVLIVDTDRRGGLHACYGPQRERYGIPPLHQLSDAPEALIPCARGEAVRYAVREYPPN